MGPIPPGVPSLDWQDLCRGPLDIATLLLHTHGFRIGFFLVFPIINLWELYVAMTTKVSIQSA